MIQISPIFQLTYPVWGTTRCSSCYSVLFKFQLTYPVWGTTKSSVLPSLVSDFNSRTPCGVQRKVPIKKRKGKKISTHVPRVGYNTTLDIYTHLSKISTHVPRVGYNIVRRFFTQTTSFQLTYPVWGTTPLLEQRQARMVISTHVPRVGYNRKIWYIKNIYIPYL